LSAKRISGGGFFLISSATKDRFPFFREEILGQLWIRELQFFLTQKKADMFAFCLLSDHFHLVIRVDSEGDLSKKMHFFKRHFSRNANIILGYSESIRSGGWPSSATNRSEVLEIDKMVKKLHIEFQKKYPNKNPFPKFSWQKSFYDRGIRDESQFITAINYVENNFLKHGLSANWKFSSKNFPEMCTRFPVFSER
jgi:REP element-mobilizing transposase RayT